MLAETVSSSAPLFTFVIDYLNTRVSFANLTYNITIYICHRLLKYTYTHIHEGNALKNLHLS